MSSVLSFTIIGLFTGAAYAIAASGLVITYATSNVFNMAHGAVGMVMAFLFWELASNRGLPLFVALFVVVCLAAGNEGVMDLVLAGSDPFDPETVQLNTDLSIGEAYVHGDFDVQGDLAAFVSLADRIHDLRLPPVEWLRMAQRLSALEDDRPDPGSRTPAVLRGERHTPARDTAAVRYHYDVGNDFYRLWLDERMVYSCAYFRAPEASLDEAQLAKLDLVIDKLQLADGMRLLDIGCGWGGLAKFAAERYGVKVTGVTVSKEQLALAQERVRGLPVELLLQDYRDLRGSFDKVVSVGMFEHVGPKNYDTYFTNVQRLMAPNGIFLLHTIGIASTSQSTDPWIDRYVFPNGKLPSAREISTAVEGRFIIEDWHNFGADYDRTLMAWHANFERHWDELAAHYDRRFYRMWRYYLLTCAGSFRARKNQLWQIVLAKGGVPGGYQAPR